jgi:hypothetical protein
MRFVLYTSVLDASKYDASVLPDILNTVRRENLNHQVTSLLLFDGHQFTQYLEGEDDAVDSLIGNILFDKRHKNGDKQQYS